MISEIDIVTAIERQATYGVAQPEIPRLPADYLVPHWYAAYTSANHEKRVASQLSMRGVEQFVPLYNSVRRWKDRRVTLHLPLFPGYVFVRIALRDRLRVVRTPGVARIVGFNGVPAVLPEKEIAALHAGVVNRIKAEPHPFLTVGRSVRINNGPLAGMTGILVRRKGKSRVVISIELLQQSVAVDMIDADIAPAF